MQCNCELCEKDYEEENKDKLLLHLQGCLTICEECSREIFNDAQKFRLEQESKSALH